MSSESARTAVFKLPLQLLCEHCVEFSSGSRALHRFVSIRWKKEFLLKTDCGYRMRDAPFCSMGRQGSSVMHQCQLSEA